MQDKAETFFDKTSETPSENIAINFQLTLSDFNLDVDINFPARGVSAIFGASGSGKTTLLKCIAGLEKPQGSMSFNGQVWQGQGFYLPPHKREVGYVFQDVQLFPHLNVIKNLRYGMNRCKNPQESILDNAIELLGIEKILERKIDKLSGGEKQRVGIARALAVNPKILLMDEPLAALDYERKNEIMPYLEKLHDDLAIPFLYVSHSLEEVARLADYMVIMKEGKAVTSGKLNDVLTQNSLPINLNKDIGTVLETRVDKIDEKWHLAKLQFDGGELWVQDVGWKVGQKRRVRILAQDISLAVELGKNSIQNILAGLVKEIIPNKNNQSSVLIRLQVGEGNKTCELLASVTKKSLSVLDIEVGQKIWLQIKSVAVIN